MNGGVAANDADGGVALNDTVATGDGDAAGEGGAVTYGHGGEF